MTLKEIVGRVSKLNFDRTGSFTYKFEETSFKIIIYFKRRKECK